MRYKNEHKRWDLFIWVHRHFGPSCRNYEVKSMPKSPSALKKPRSAKKKKKKKNFSHESSVKLGVVIEHTYTLTNMAHAHTYIHSHPESDIYVYCIILYYTTFLSWEHFIHLSAFLPSGIHPSINPSDSLLPKSSPIISSAPIHPSNNVWRLESRRALMAESTHHIPTRVIYCHLHGEKTK